LFWFWEVILLVDRTFKLSLAERLSLGSVLPKEGDIITVRVLLKLREEVFLASDEIEKYDVKALPDGSVAWNAEGAKFRRQYVWDTVKVGIVKKALEDLNAQHKLRLDLLPLYETFVEGKDS
jgi:hypothetical protein